MHNARMMFRRGFDNVCILRGTVNEFYQHYPEMVLGENLPALESVESRIPFYFRAEKNARNYRKKGESNREASRKAKLETSTGQGFS